MFNSSGAWGLLSQLAKRARGKSGWTVSFGFSTSGPSIFQFGLRSNDFAALAAFSGELVPFDELDEVAKGVYANLVEAVDSLRYIGPDMADIINKVPEFFEALSRSHPCTNNCVRTTATDRLVEGQQCLENGSGFYCVEWCFPFYRV